MRLRTWVRTWFRTDRAPAETCARPRAVRPALEILEERLVLSTTALDYQLWRQARYAVTDQAVSTTPPVAGVQSVGTLAVNTSFGTQIGLDKAFAGYSYRGTGYSVAVIDTGIDYTHGDLGGTWGKRVIAGYDFVNSDSDPRDDNGHGTHVAGIIGSSSTTYSGVAPNVNLIALKVLDAQGAGSFGAVEDALKWVIARKAQYNIVAVNLSLGASNYTVNPYTFLEDEFASLKQLGVFTAVAAGNDFYGNSSAPGLAYPAISPQVVSVGAVWDGNFGAIGWGSGARDTTTAPDRIASFSQRGSALSIMAPGALINSTVLGGAYQSMAGTSMASPVVAGAAVLLHQALGAKRLAANQDSILALMRNTGVTVNDGDDENDNVVNTGLNFKRLNLAAALGAVGPVGNVAPTLDAIADQKLRAGRSLVLTIPGNDLNDDPLIYSARIIDQSSQAYQFDQQLGLAFNGSYYTNTWSAGEKWLIGTAGVWYCLMPNGELRRWAGTMIETQKPANLIATLGTAYYADPSLLWDAKAGLASQVSLQLAGSRLTLSAPAGTVGTFGVQITVSDGKLTATRTFNVVIAANSAPVLGTLENQSVISGTTLFLALPGSDADGDALAYTARIVDQALLATLTLQGGRLTVRPSAGYLGPFTVEVSVSDGLAVAKKTFTVEIHGNWTTQAAGDVNADGKDDLVSFNAGDGTWWVNLSTGVGFTLQRWVNLGSAGAWSQNVVGDFNGDRKADVASFHSGLGTWYVGLSTGTGFSVSPWAQNWARGSVWTHVYAGDFTGDGKADLAAFHVSGQWWVAQSTGTGFNTSLWAGNWSGGTVWQFHVGDFNGDGKKDVGAFHTTGEWWVAQSTGAAFSTTRWDRNWSAGNVWLFYVGDYDGDGRDDVGAFHTTGEWWVARSAGTGFSTARWAERWSTGNVWSFLAGDFDGDTKLDLGAFHNTGEWWLAQSLGATFQTSRWGSAWSTRDHWRAFLAGDFDGDGKDDVASLSTAGQWWLARSTGTAFQSALWSSSEM